MKSSKKKVLNVLLLDDEPLLINLYEQVLHSDFTVFKAQNICEAQSVLGKEDIHILISDHYLGNENGLNFLNDLHKRNPRIIKIILSSCTHHEVIIQSHNSGAVFRYLTKPCSNEDLLENVKLAEIAWEIKEFEVQLNEEHRSLSEAFKEVDLIEVKKHKHLESVTFLTNKTLKSLLYIALALLLSGSCTLVFLYCLKSILGFDIFQ